MDKTKQKVFEVFGYPEWELCNSLRHCVQLHALTSVCTLKIHVRVRWIMETLKTPSMHPRLCSATLSQLAFRRESNPNFPWKKCQWDNTVMKRNPSIQGPEKYLYFKENEPRIQRLSQASLSLLMFSWAQCVTVLSPFPAFLCVCVLLFFGLFFNFYFMLFYYYYYYCCCCCYSTFSHRKASYVPCTLLI